MASSAISAGSVSNLLLFLTGFPRLLSITPQEEATASLQTALVVPAAVAASPALIRPTHRHRMMKSQATIGSL